jgi:hypothetical protein
MGQEPNRRRYKADAEDRSGCEHAGEHEDEGSQPTPLASAALEVNASPFMVAKLRKAASPRLPGTRAQP